MHDERYASTVRNGSDGEGAPSPHGLTPSQRWGKFLIEKRLGGGGQAQVFQAYDQLGTAGHVALKVPLEPVPPEHVQEWIQTEAGSLVKLEHPNIVRVLDAGVIDGVPYVATPLIEGLTMREHVQANPPPLRQVLDWMIQLADALHTAHSRGIVHRDVKPRNIVVTTQGRPMLIDFGVASLVTHYQPEARHDGSGTYIFMAPEQGLGDPGADHRVDVFGLGGVLKFLLVGEGPYRETEGTLEAIIEGNVALIEDESGPALRRALCRIANRALHPDPARRYQSAREMARALRRVRARRPLLAVAGAVVLTVVAVLALFGPGGILRGVGVEAKAGPQAVQATLEIHLQRKDETGLYHILTADDLPLHGGDRIQIHGGFEEPLWAYVIAVSSVGGAKVVYPKGKMDHGPVSEVHIPPGRDEWFEISPPGGTETILLLARRQPLADPKAFSETLLALGPAPTLDGAGLYVIDQAGPRLVPGGVVRQLGEKPVTVEKGFLDLLRKGVPEQWEVVRVLAFPQESAAASQQG